MAAWVEAHYRTLTFFVDFGEAAALLPAALVIALFLALGGRSRLAITWLATIAIAIAVTALFKLDLAALASARLEDAEDDPSILSGHASLAMAFYGGLAVLVWRAGGTRLQGRRWLALLLAAIVPMMMGLVWLMGWHDMGAVLKGALVGAVCPFAMAASPTLSEHPRIPVAAMLTAVALVVALLHGLRFDYSEVAAAAIAMITGGRS